MSVVLDEKAETETEKCFVVVDSNHHFLWYGTASGKEEAVKQARLSNLYDKTATLYVYEVVNEYIVKPQEARV